ncbi:hypothetical protein LAD67_14330 [Escherichia coli]|nr:hypothetical protein [Escherichia coli]
MLCLLLQHVTDAVNGTDHIDDEEKIPADLIIASNNNAAFSDTLFASSSQRSA